MNPTGFFSANYLEARERFLDAVAVAGLTPEHHVNPERGPAGEELTTDVARIGPDSAARVFLTVSGTHGVEGFCGSGVQVGMLRTGAYADLPADTAVVLVHAINPFGFAWLRRTNEDNVDLNRNHVDHALPQPDNPGYRELADAICPPAWDDATRAAADARLEAYAGAHGAMALTRALGGGQYSHPDGVFFGGTRLTWSARTLYDIVARHAAGARHLAVIDYHTGLGPYGYGELQGENLGGHPGFARAQAWLENQVTSTDDGSSSSGPLTGTTADGIDRMLPDFTSFTMISLEYGTFDNRAVRNSIRADAWLHAHGDPASVQGRGIKAEIRRCFYPDADDWKQMVWERALWTERRMLTGLARLD